ncbi:MAG: RagB/SusD family nutrient uptake outer membrane protein [Niabella sp.]
MKKKISVIILYIALAFGMGGCKKYLDVNPKSTLSEDELYTSEVGFQQALTGIYSLLASRSLYGDNLTMGFVSALAQNYDVSGSTAPFVQTKALNYSSDEVMEYTQAIWDTAYNAIAGLNKIIANTEKYRSVLTGTNYALIRGEAMGLRALLHFEVLRIFGPEYVTGAGVKAIPYKKTADQYTVVPYVTSEVVAQALADLDTAAGLLKTTDPILDASPNRRIKMNYYAVKALEARIRLYSGDKTGAFAAAQEVVNSGKFPFVTTSAASAAAGTRDRLYLTEQVFCVRVRDMLDWVDFYFRYNGSASLKLTRTDAADFNTLYETASGGGTDLRYLYRIEDDQGAPFPSKFWQTYQFDNLDSNRLDQYVPAIRLSEMYYIMAETALTPAEGVGYLNTVRTNRALPELPTSVTQATLDAEITKEYQKEFYAEGQLFFYYKRKNVVRMQFMTSDISLNLYQLPIPEDELEFNPNY